MLNSVKAYQSNLFDPDVCGHGFFTRLGGVSPGIYASLNFFNKSGDSLSNIATNKQLAAQYFGYDGGDIRILNQVHSNKVIVVDEKNFDQDFNLILADSLVTRMPDILLGVITADCVPLLFIDEASRVIATAHAGWRGALSGIVVNTIATMVKQGASKQNIKVAIGPSIAHESYEVDHNFKIKFLEQSKNNEVFFKSTDKSEHYLFNLKGYIIKCLELENVLSYQDIGIDTYKSESEFFSCRRSYHQGQLNFGDQISIIFLK